MNVRRKTPSGRTIAPKVLLRPVYLDSTRDVIGLIERAMKRCRDPKRGEFAKLVGRTPQSIDNWKARRAKIPLTTVMKACQILGNDVWKIIDGKKLYSSGHESENHIIFHNIESPKLAEIMAWIKTDGHLFINKTCLYFVQNKEGFECIKDIVKDLCDLFEISKNKILIKKKSGKPNAKCIYLWSAPLRQILHLRYKIPI